MNKMCHRVLHRSGSDVHLDWTTDGLQLALRQRRIVVIVDVLRFSSAVTTAVANGFIVYPVAEQNRVEQLARRLSANAAGRSGEARFSLSPLSYLHISPAGARKIVLWSPNGAACASLIRSRDRAFVGCLLNARALAWHLNFLARQQSCGITLIAAGEQQARCTGERILYDLKASRRVFAIEDYLGCGAILAHLRLPKTPEARVCESAFLASRRGLKNLLLNSFSGLFLQQKGLTADVLWASQLNRYDVVPIIRHDRIEAVSDAAGKSSRTRRKI